MPGQNILPKVSKQLIKTMLNRDVIIFGGSHLEFSCRIAMMKNLQEKLGKGLLDQNAIGMGLETLIADEPGKMMKRAMVHVENGRTDLFSSELENVRAAPEVDRNYALAEFTDEAISRSFEKFCKRNGIRHCQLDPEGINEFVWSEKNSQKFFGGDMKFIRQIEDIRIKGMLTNAANMNMPITLMLVGSAHLPGLMHNCPTYFDAESGKLRLTGSVLCSGLTENGERAMMDAIKSGYDSRYKTPNLSYLTADLSGKFTNSVFEDAIKEAVRSQEKDKKTQVVR